MKHLRCSPCVRISREHPIIIGTNILKENLPKLIKSYSPDKITIISDTNMEKPSTKNIFDKIFKIYGNYEKTKRRIVKGGNNESNKRINQRGR